MTLRHTIAAFAALCGLAITATDADAAFKVQITVNGGPVFEIVDNGANDSVATSGVAGILSFAGAIGDAELVVESATSNRINQLPADRARLTNSISVNNLSGGPLSIFIRVTDTLFTHPGDGPYIGRSEATGLDGIGTLQSFFDDTLGGTNEFGTEEPITPAPEPFEIGGNDDLRIIFGTRPYSLTQHISFTVGAGPTGATGLLLTTTEITAVPEPTSLALLGLGGVGLLGGAIRRRRAAKTA